jgi:hypothetical protein
MPARDLAETSRVGCAVEIIVVNNNSTDRTPQVVSTIAGVAIVDEPKRDWCKPVARGVSPPAAG